MSERRALLSAAGNQRMVGGRGREIHLSCSFSHAMLGIMMRATHGGLPNSRFKRAPAPAPDSALKSQKNLAPASTYGLPGSSSPTTATTLAPS